MVSISRPPRFLIIVAAAVATANGCTDGTEVGSGAASRWSLSDTLSIGVLQGDGPDVFGWIVGIAVDHADRIHVFDGQARELRIFDADGSFISRFGRRGAGPGEFEHVIGISTTPDGATWLVDGANARYTVVRDGEADSYRRGVAVYSASWLGGFADDHLHDAVLLTDAGGPQVLQRVNHLGEVVDTFSLPDAGVRAPQVGSIRLPLPYAPRALYAFDPRGGVWVGTSHEYVLHLLGLNGDTLLTVRRNLTSPPLSALEADSVARHIHALREQLGVQVDEALIPRTAPLLDHITTSDDGFLWVTRAASPGGSATGTKLDVFDPAGDFVAEVELAFPLDLMAVRNGRLYGVARDELDVQRVFRASVQRR